MRNKIILIIIILTLSISAFSRPMKAAYVSTWNPGVLSRSEVDKTIDAAKSAGITDIRTIDTEFSSFLGLFGTYCVVVTGE